MYITIIVFCGINYILKLQDSNNLILFLFFKNENVYSLSFTKIKKKNSYLEWDSNSKNFLNSDRYLTNYATPFARTWFKKDVIA